MYYGYFILIIFMLCLNLDIFQPYIIVSYNDEMIVARYESPQIVQKIMTDKNLFPTKREILYATYTNC